MNQPDTKFSVSELQNYSDADAAAIGAILPYLSDKFSGEPVPKDRLKTIINSPYHLQLVARGEDNLIVGIATISLLMGAGSGYTAWLEDFVVSPAARGSGVADTLWQAAIDWCEKKQAKSLNFTSKPSREAAQHFYKKRGAVIRETNVFRKSVNS